MDVVENESARALEIHTMCNCGELEGSLVVVVFPKRLQDAVTGTFAQVRTPASSASQP